MYDATEQIAGISKVHFDNALKIASLTLEKAERLAKLNLQSAKLALEQGAQSADAIAGATDVEELYALRAKFTETGIEHASAYSRGLYEVATDAHADFSALAQEAWSAYRRRVEAWVEEASKEAPAGADFVVSAVKSTVAATSAAFEQFSKATMQIADLADANIHAADADTAHETKTTTKPRKSAA